MVRKQGGLILQLQSPHSDHTIVETHEMHTIRHKDYSGFAEFAVLCRTAQLLAFR